VKYVKGKDNVTADTLSRIFEDMTDEQKLDFVPQTEPDDDLSYHYRIHYNRLRRIKVCIV